MKRAQSFPNLSLLGTDVVVYPAIPSEEEEPAYMVVEIDTSGVWPVKVVVDDVTVYDGRERQDEG